MSMCYCAYSILAGFQRENALDIVLITCTRVLAKLVLWQRRCDWLCGIVTPIVGNFRGVQIFAFFEDAHLSTK